MDTILAGEGYKVFVAANGRDALDLLKFGLKPAVIVLDLMMPVANGFDFLAELKEQPALQHPVIVLSVSSSYTAEELGVAEVLRKPARLEEILAAVERAS